ncbi:VUT family protein [Legionella pneumophila serogroup 1]
MSSVLASKSKIPLQLKVFHTLLGIVVFFSLITIPAERHLILFSGIETTSDMLWWPFVFTGLYLIHRIYGFGYFRHSVYLVIFFRICYLLFLQLAIWLPSSSFWTMQETYTHVLGRDIQYMILSSVEFWVCSLVLIRLLRPANNILSKMGFFISLISFTTLDHLLIHNQNNNFEQSFIVLALIFSFLMILVKPLTKLIINIEKFQPEDKDYSLFKISAPLQQKDQHNIFKYHHILFCSSIVFFIASKTMAAKFISIGFVTINAGGIVFSLAYLASDIMTDVYGIERTKQMIFFVIFANLLFVFDIWLSNLLAVNANGGFQHIFHNQARIFLASGVAFFLGMTINSTVISMIKARQRKRGISLKKEFITTVWARVATSSSFGIILDVSLFSLVAFFGVVPHDKLASIVIFEDIYKISYEVLLAPVSVLLIYALKVTEKIDIYDKIDNLNPFKVNTNYQANANKFYENYIQNVRRNDD